MRYILTQQWSGRDKERIGTADSYADAMFIVRALNKVYGGMTILTFAYEEEEEK